VEEAKARSHHCRHGGGLEGTQFVVREISGRERRKVFAKGRCPLCRGDEDSLHILLKSSETKWREQILNGE
jgi:hypothetical protein